MSTQRTRLFGALTLLAAGVLAGCSDSTAPRATESTANLTIRDGLVWTPSGAVFSVAEWPTIPNVRGRAALEALARDGWKPLDDLELKVIPSARRIGADHAAEFGAFEESWRDSTGARKVEFGRYAEALTRQPDGSWLIDHWLGFEDSTVTRPSAAK